MIKKMLLNNPRFIYLNYLLLLFSVLLAPSRLLGQPSDNDKSIPLFSSDEVVYLTLRGDLKSAIKDLRDNPDEYQAFIEYYDPEKNDSVKLEVTIQTRGNFRKKMENCSFPPLKINFKKKQTDNTLFEGINKVKLVTNCKSDSKLYQRYVLEEYLIYQTYNLVTDTSYRTRLAYITYIDNGSDKIMQESYSIFIEPDNVLEKRLGLQEIQNKYIMPDNTQFDHISKLSVFQYMVGNTDWAVTTLHNIKLYAIDSTQRPYAIPYDFDWCGVINANYAKPLPSFGTETVTDRVFKGYCRTLDQFIATFDFFRHKKDEFYDLYSNFTLLKDSEISRILKYYDEFYRIIGNEKSIKREFLDTCYK